MAVAAVTGGKSRSVLAVSPGKSCKKLFLTAFVRVVSDGENSAAWANATSSFALLGWLTRLTWSCGMDLVIATGTIHNPVDG